MKKRPNPIDVYIGARIRARRMMAKLSQTQLADLSKITFQQVQKYEKGTNRVSGSRLAEFAAALECPVAWFFEGAPGQVMIETPADRVIDFLSTSEGVAINEAFIAIKDPRIRGRLIDIARAIGGQ